MADEPQALRLINWRELFPFTHLFRAFQIAIHPSKLFLGLLLVLSLYLGGRVLDVLWPARQYPGSGEIDLYSQYEWGHERGSSFEPARDQVRLSNAQQYRDLLKGANIVADEKTALDDGHRGNHYGKLRERAIAQRNKEISDTEEAYSSEMKAANAMTDAAERDRQIAMAREHRDAEMAAAQDGARRQLAMLHDIAPQPVFAEFLQYETRQFRNIIHSTLSGDWVGGISAGSPTEAAVPTFISPSGRNPLAANAMAGSPLTGGFMADVMRTARVAGPVSVVQAVGNFALIGPGWLIRYHWLYFILYVCWFLLMWAIFGGAIARIAAVHVSRDEKISVRQALRFSTSKVLSFIFAPIIPLIIILIAGLLVAAGGLLMYIPVLGPIVVGALFVVALVAGFVMTLVVAGTVGGFNLMYPTVAVEGSDSFDAISRSFSYVFARPWRALFYTMVALVYGAITFLFCRTFVFVMLSLTHFFAGWWLQGKPGRYWPEIWPSVSYEELSYHLVYPALAWSERIAATLISLWIYVILGLLAGFVISFYFSANTIIYFLVRREVDATELDDVYLEETDDDFSDAAPAGAPKIETVSTPEATVSVVTMPVPPGAS